MLKTWTVLAVLMLATTSVFAVDLKEARLSAQMKELQVDSSLLDPNSVKSASVEVDTLKGEVQVLLSLQEGTAAFSLPIVSIRTGSCEVKIIKARLHGDEIVVRDFSETTCFFGQVIHDTTVELQVGGTRSVLKGGKLERL